MSRTLVSPLVVPMRRLGRVAHFARSRLPNLVGFVLPSIFRLGTFSSSLFSYEQNSFNPTIHNEVNRMVLYEGFSR